MSETLFNRTDIYVILNKKHVFDKIWDNPQVWKTKAELITRGNPVLANGSWKDGLLDYLLYKEMFDAIQYEPFAIDQDKVKLLIDHGANPNMITPWNFGYSLLHILIICFGQTRNRKNIDLLRHVINNGGDVNILDGGWAKDDSGRAQTPLDYTESYPDMTEIIEILREHGGIHQEEWTNYEDKLDLIKDRNQSRYGQQQLDFIFKNGKVSDKYQLPEENGVIAEF